MIEEFPSAEEPEVKAEPVEETVPAKSEPKKKAVKAKPAAKAKPESKEPEAEPEAKHVLGEKYQAVREGDLVKLSQQGWVGPAPIAIHKDDIKEVVSLLNKI